MKQSVLSICLLVLGFQNGLGQSTGSRDAHVQPFLQRPSQSNGHHWWIINEAAQVNPADWFSHYGRHIGVQPAHSFKLIGRKTDELGMNHDRYQLFHQGIPVKNSHYFLHSFRGELKHAHGAIPEIPMFAFSDTISSEEATELIEEHLDGASFAWEDPDWLFAHHSESDSSMTDWHPHGEIVIGQFQDQLGHTHFPLLWEFKLRLLDPDEWVNIQVDAFSGKILHVINLRHQCQPEPASGNTLYNGSQIFKVKSRGWPNSDYILKDCSDASIHTKVFELNSFGQPKSWGRISEVSHDDPTWEDEHLHAQSAHWATQQAQAWFSDALSYQPATGSELKTRVFVDWRDAVNQIQGNSMHEFVKGIHYLYIGQMDGMSLATLDVVGHEYAHGIVAETAGLVYEREAGALNESFCDIFGVMIQRHAQTSGAIDWTIAEDIRAIRSLESPWSFQQASSFGTSDPFWVPTHAQECPVAIPGLPPFGNDNCGIHFNSGVQNHWFYLLSVGGSQLNIPVEPIGPDAAAQIAFRSLQFYLHPTASFEDARRASIQSAEDLFGRCSPQWIQVQNAWAAVGVGNPHLQLCPHISGPDTVCLNAVGKYSLTMEASAPDASLTWTSIPTGWLYSLSGPNETILNLEPPEILTPGTYFVSVSARRGTEEVRSSHPIHFVECTDPDSDPASPPRGPSPYLFAAPNPTFRNATLYFPYLYNDGDLSVFDPQGRLVHRESIESSGRKVDLSHLTQGLYYLQLKAPSMAPITTMLQLLPSP
ncbi:M4 family metallopeptidase [Pontibacter sp. G13]|uniref:M4 family metallopeptidase n=1 Tax=Pontibacter sp. G13 TaxID=3074898 RepID=UPI00288986BF|nr:M4 family metallopeptidase [Pontibacter sp. G13]WNJ19538.1 M4 family metallopeptidase [Pontibacter sp. G13]